MRARRSLGYHPHPATIGRREAYRRVLWPYWLVSALFAFALLCLAAAAAYHAAPTIVPSPAGRPPTATGGRDPRHTPPPAYAAPNAYPVHPIRGPGQTHQPPPPIEHVGGLSNTGVSMTTDTIVTTCGCGRPGCVKIRAIPTSRWMCRTCLAAYAATHRWVGR